MRHRPQLTDQRFQFFKHQPIACRKQHQGLRGVVDVFAGAGKVNELKRLGKSRVTVVQAEHGLLEKVLDRLDIMVGVCLNRLDAVRLLDAKVLGDRIQCFEIVALKARQLRKLEVTQGLQPGNFNPHPVGHKTRFRKNRCKIGKSRGVASIKR